MNRKYLLITLLLVILLANCKKEKIASADSLYPAIFEFTEEGAEETTMGLVRFPNHGNGSIFRIQNTRYYPNIATTRTVHHILDVNKPAGKDLIQNTRVIYSQLGNYNRTGNIQLHTNKFNFSGVSAYTKPATFETSFILYLSTFTNTISPLKFTESNLEISKLINVKDGFLLVGARINGTDKNVVVIKYSIGFAKIWEKEFGGAGDDMAMDAVQLCDNNYGILAYTYSKGAGDRDVWFLKIDANGFLIWDYTYGGAAYEEPQKIVTRTGCDIYIAGHSSSFGAPEHDGYILRINENGDKIWEKTFGTPNHDGFNAVTHIPNTKRFIAAGRSMQGVGQPEDIFIVCFNEAGDELWRKKYGDPNLTELPQGIEADNEFYYLACNRVDAAGNYSSVFIKDKQGN